MKAVYATPHSLRDLETKGTVSEEELLLDEREDLDSRFCATSWSKLLHFLLADLLCLEASQKQCSWQVKEGLSVTRKLAQDLLGTALLGQGVNFSSTDTGGLWELSFWELLL